MNFGESRFKKY